MDSSRCGRQCVGIYDAILAFPLPVLFVEDGVDDLPAGILPCLNRSGIAHGLETSTRVIVVIGTVRLGAHSEDGLNRVALEAGSVGLVEVDPIEVIVGEGLQIWD